MIYILDNFLSFIEIDKLAIVASGSTIPWRTSAVVGSEQWDTSIAEKYNFQFTHMFLDARRADETMINQKTYDFVSPVVNKINADDWYRIKMNLNPCAPQILEHGMHIDNPTQRKDAYTAVFYINDNDGYTIFKTGEKIQSVSNRLVVFPADLYHSGTTCTNTSMRIVLNLNFYKTNINELVGDTKCQ
jgi:hypothetical protein